MPSKKDSKEEEMMEHAKKDAMEAMEMARAKFMEAEERIERAIRDDPVHAAMVAAGVGAAIGAAVAMAVMKKKKGKE